MWLCHAMLMYSSLPTNPEKEKQIYAMKVIRKSDMLRNGQEGHLRAERDFLVSSEGSRWYVIITQTSCLQIGLNKLTQGCSANCKLSRPK